MEEGKAPTERLCAEQDVPGAGPAAALPWPPGKQSAACSAHSNAGAFWSEPPCREAGRRKWPLHLLLLLLLLSSLSAFLWPHISAPWLSPGQASFGSLSNLKHNPPPHHSYGRAGGRLNERKRHVGQQNGHNKKTKTFRLAHNSFVLQWMLSIPLGAAAIGRQNRKETKKTCLSNLCRKKKEKERE